MSVEQRLAALEQAELKSMRCPSCRHRLSVVIIENDDPPSCNHCGAVLGNVPSDVLVIRKKYVGVSMKEL